MICIILYLLSLFYYFITVEILPLVSWCPENKWCRPQNIDGFAVTEIARTGIYDGNDEKITQEGQFQQQSAAWNMKEICHLHAILLHVTNRTNRAL